MYGFPTMEQRIRNLEAEIDLLSDRRRFLATVIMGEKHDYLTSYEITSAAEKLGLLESVERQGSLRREDPEKKGWSFVR